MGTGKRLPVRQAPGDRSGDQIAHGFMAIAQTLTGSRGIPGKPRGAMSYFGWTLKEPPHRPDDSTADTPQPAP